MLPLSQKYFYFSEEIGQTYCRTQMPDGSSHKCLWCYHRNMWTRQDDPTISPICHCPNTEVVIKGHIFYGIAETIIPGFFVIMPSIQWKMDLCIRRPRICKIGCAHLRCMHIFQTKAIIVTTLAVLFVATWNSRLGALCVLLKKTHLQDGTDGNFLKQICSRLGCVLLKIGNCWQHK